MARQAGDVLQEAWAWQLHRARPPHAAVTRMRRLDAVRAAAELFERAGDVDAVCQALLVRGDIALRPR